MKLPEFRRPDRGRGRLGGPDLRVPDFVVDLYVDLRDRRLLPLVALLIVAIIAAPILLSGSTKKNDAVPVAAGSDVGTDTASFSVVPAASELQEYKKRLAHRRSVNPFNAWSATKHRTPSRQEFKEVAEAETGASATGTEATTTSTSGESAPTTTVIEKPKVVKATLKAQVGVAAVLKTGFNGSGPREIEVENQARLPQKNPAVIYNGTSKKEGALFLMTSQVSEFSGEGHCVLGGSLCQVVELKVGQSETFAVGYGETRYTVRLMGFEPVVKEEVVEAEGRKVRVPDHRGGKSGNEGNGGDSEEAIGTKPSPRLLIP